MDKDIRNLYLRRLFVVLGTGVFFIITYLLHRHHNSDATILLSILTSVAAVLTVAVCFLILVFVLCIDSRVTFSDLNSVKFTELYAILFNEIFWWVWGKSPKKENERRHIPDCPLCGKPVDLTHYDTIQRFSISNFHTHTEKYVWEFKCPETLGGCGMTIFGESYEEAITKWSRRVK